MNKKKVVIESAYRWDYFQWFLLGFYELQKKEKIDFKINFTPISFLLNIIKNKHLCFILSKLKKFFEKDSYNLKGYIEDENGKRRKFCIDSSDSPFLFDSDCLEKTDVYFKIQCPKNINVDGFYLTKDIKVSWLDHAHEDYNVKNLTDLGERKKCQNFSKNRFKIKPLMIGPRRLGRSINYEVLKNGYEKMINGRNISKEKKIMCYFGNARGPQKLIYDEPVDFDDENNIMGVYKEILNHPNEKRKKIADMIDKIYGEKADARVINNEGSDIDKIKSKVGAQVVPLEKFGEFVGKFEYNVNVSGYRLSIPSRFIDSFSVGTAIVTDKLSVKWYKPFDENEVIEISEMGYLLNDDVDWKKINEDIKSLPQANKEKILENFKEKWSPEVVANYIISTTLKE